MKYKAKHDIEHGAKLKIVKEKMTSYGTLKVDEVVTLEEITHFPTLFNVIDSLGQSWVLFSYDFEEISEE